MPDQPTTIELPYFPPYDWAGLADFLRVRTLKGVEWVSDDAYLRTAALAARRGWIRVRPAPEKSALHVEISASLAPCVTAVTQRLAHLFDLSARPEQINTALKKDPLLRARIAGAPGLRVPGAFDGFELAVRAILGQQITVKAATTLGGRFVEAFGEPLETPFPELLRLSPPPEKIAALAIPDIASLGIIRTRAGSILAVAEACASGRLKLEPGADPAATMGQLTALPGIGPWTAHYIAMRALCWPDAFPKEDIAVRNNLGGVTPKQAEVISQRWRPWRSYAVLHVWRH